MVGLVFPSINVIVMCRVDRKKGRLEVRNPLSVVAAVWQVEDDGLK